MILDMLNPLLDKLVHPYLHKLPTQGCISNLFLSMSPILRCFYMDTDLSS